MFLCQTRTVDEPTRYVEAGLPNVARIAVQFAKLGQTGWQVLARVERWQHADSSGRIEARLPRRESKRTE